MAEVRVKFSVSMVIALVLAELFSLLWYTHFSPWHHHLGHRNLVTAVIFGAIVIYILKYIKETYWTIRGWEDAAVLSMWLALLYAGYQAPHYVYDQYSLSYFIYHVAHKFLYSFIALFALHSFRNH